MFTDGNGDYTFSDPIERPENTLELGSINIPAGEVLDGFIHNHYDKEGSLSIFSPHDLYAIYNWLTNGNINDNNSFIFAITISDNTTYAITIDDPQAFIAFGDIALEGLQFDPTTNNIMIDEYGGDEDAFLGSDGGVKDTNTNDLNETNLLKLLNAASAGLNVFKSNDSFENWQQLDYNPASNNVTRQDCN